MNTPISRCHPICIIGNSNSNYLKEYILLGSADKCTQLAFKNLDLNKLIAQSPKLIIVDLFSLEDSCTNLVKQIEKTFAHIPVYFLSPEYSGYQTPIKSIDCPNHYYSGFNRSVLHLINKFITLQGRKNNISITKVQLN